MGIPLLRIGNITKDGTIDESNLVFLSDKKANTLKSTQVEPFDLVISQRGTLGIPAVVPSSYKVWNISANLIAIRKIKKLLPEYIQLYLSCKLGAKQLERNQSGQVQGKLTTEDIASILIPNVGVQQKLVEKMQAARESRKQKLAQADELLDGMDAFFLTQLGLTIPPTDERFTYATKLRQIVSDNRIAADYFHPERVLALKAIQKSKNIIKSEQLCNMVDFIRDIEKKVSSYEGYIGLANVQSNTGELVEIIDDKGKGQSFRYRKDDILFARLRPYLNKVYKAEKNGVCSTEFHVIRIRKGKNSLLPDYLAVVLRSSIIVAQTKHMMTGNTHPRLANDDVVNLLIPIPSSNIQAAIVAEVINRRKKARQLREEAERDWQRAKADFEAQLVGKGAAL